MNSKSLVALGLGALALSACSTSPYPGGSIESVGFGEANRQTYAAMVVNPEPEYDTEMAGSAQKASDAIERYDNDAVKEPENIRSSSGPRS